jgi:hypothetical protein
MSGHHIVEDSVTDPAIHIVLTAMVGFAGLEPTIAAVKAGKHIALANKETLVVAGELITGLAKQHNVNYCRLIRSIRPYFNAWPAKQETNRKDHHDRIRRALPWENGRVLS